MHFTNRTSHSRWLLWLLIGVLLLTVVVGPAGAATAESAPILGTWEEKLAALADPEGRLMSCAHRGFWANSEGYPENSVPAILEAGAIGVDIVEIDVQKTADGQYILLHDGNLWRTTNIAAFYGRQDWPNADSPGALTLADLRRLSLLEGAGGSGARVTSYRIPTLEEALDAAREAGVILLLDKAWSELAGICAVIDDADAWEYCMFQASDQAWQKQLAAQQTQYGASAQPFYGLFFNQSTPEAVGDAAVAYFGDDSKPLPAWTYLNAAGLGRAATAGEYVAIGTDAAMIAAVDGKTRRFLNTLVSGPNVDNPAVWAQLYAGGVNIIQSDNPEELATFIREMQIDGFRYGFEGTDPWMPFGGGGDRTPAGALAGRLVSVGQEGIAGEGLTGRALRLTVTDPTFAAGHDTGWIRAVYQDGSSWDTNWMGAQDVQFYVNASACSAPLRLHFALMGTKTGTQTEGVWGEPIAGAPAGIRAEGQSAWTPQAVRDNAYIVLPAGFTGWVRFSVRDEDLRAVWQDTPVPMQESLWRVASLCVSVSGDAVGSQPSAAIVHQPVYIDSFAMIKNHILGDINGDGRVTVTDARLALRAVVGKITLTEEQQPAADINGDGRVTTADARRILRYAVGKVDVL